MDALELLIDLHRGYSPVGYFTLPASCWWQGYYGPLKHRFEDFLEAHQHSSTAQTVVEEFLNEMQLYQDFGEYYSYGFYIAKRVD